jgi:hypothetical protein
VLSFACMCIDAASPTARALAVVIAVHLCVVACVFVGVVPQTTRVGVDPSMGPRVKEWYKALLYAASGVLFEDASVLIGVQAQYNGSAGRMMLHFRNRASVRGCGACERSLWSVVSRV